MFFKTAQELFRHDRECWGKSWTSEKIREEFGGSRNHSQAVSGNRQLMLIFFIFISIIFWIKLVDFDVSLHDLSVVITKVLSVKNDYCEFSNVFKNEKPLEVIVREV
jgi:hypothetical protein